jgi:hypothetical protein
MYASGQQVYGYDTVFISLTRPILAIHFGEIIL